MGQTLSIDVQKPIALPIQEVAADAVEGMKRSV